MNVKGLPAHFDLFEGTLYDTRKPFETGAIRPQHEWHYSRISKARHVAATLRAGCVTWPGCYPLYFITCDGEAMCFDCVRKEFRRIVADFLTGDSGWKIAACEMNEENQDLFCCHCNEQIPSAWGDQ